MNAIKTLSLAALLALAGTASATSFVVTTDAVVGAVGATSEAISDVSSSFADDKIVLAARDDAGLLSPARATSVGCAWRPLCSISVSRHRCCRATICSWRRRSSVSEFAHCQRLARSAGGTVWKNARLTQSQPM